MILTLTIPKNEKSTTRQQFSPKLGITPELSSHTEGRIPLFVRSLQNEWIASFLGFTQPKTALTPWTERGLTSEFGMGSGGSHALWPATRDI